MSRIDPESAPGAKFISVRRWQAGPEWRPQRHSHGFCEIIVVLRGVELVKVDGTSVYCHPGFLMFYPPECLHEERQTGKAPLDFLCLNFEWATFPPGIPRMLHDRQGRVQELVRWLLAEARTRHSDRGQYQDAGTNMLAAELRRLVDHPADDILGPVFEYIQEHLADSLSLEDLAASCHLNKFHLSRLFRARTGMTPMEYVRQSRLDLAHRLLLESNLPLREIAPRAGFANEYHLSRLFKERYGRGARDLRRSNVAESEPAE